MSIGTQNSPADQKRSYTRFLSDETDDFKITRGHSNIILYELVQIRYNFDKEMSVFLFLVREIKRILHLKSENGH